MPAPGSRPTVRRYPEAVRRRLEVATAMAWEALVDGHTEQALRFVALLEGRVPFDEALLRYLRETDVPKQMAAAVETRVLVELEDEDRRGGPAGGRWSADPAPEADDGASEAADDEGRRFRLAGLVRGVRERYRRNEEVERWIELAIARAEEVAIGIHIDNALTFAALLAPHAALPRAVEEYISTMGVAGGRAQAVFQRTMARLADVHLPPQAGGGADAAPPAD